MINAILFDFDGTLVDSVWIWKKVDEVFLHARNLDVPCDLHESIAGKGFSETAQYFKKRFSLPDSEEAIKQEWLTISNDLYMHDVALKPGVHDILEWLTQCGILCAIGSSNNYDTISSICTTHNIVHYFSCILTSCDVGKGKPAPDLFLEIANRIKVCPSRILVVDDIVEGIQAGKSAGMVTVGIFDEWYNNQIQLMTDADYYITSLSELRNIVADIP